MKLPLRPRWSRHRRVVIGVAAPARAAALSAGSVAVSAGDVTRWAVIGVAIVATAVVVLWFVGARRHPETAADHAASEVATAHAPDGVARRPAGPAAESMDPDPPGGRTPPAPWPGSSAVPPDASGAPD